MADRGGAIDAARFCRAVRAQRRAQHLRDARLHWPAWPIAALPAAALAVALLAAAASWRPQALTPTVRSRQDPSVPMRLAATSGQRVEPHAWPGSSRKVALIRPDEDVRTALIDAGIVPADASRAAHLVEAAIFPDRVAPGTTLVIVGATPGTSGRMRLQELSLRPRLDLLLNVRRKLGALALASRPIAVDATPLELAGTVGSDLARSLLLMHTPAAQVGDVQALLREHLQPAIRLLPSDRIELVFDQSRAVDGRVEIGGLLYVALRRGDRPLLEMVRWRGNRDLADVEEDCSAGGSPSGTATPVAGHLTSRYGMRFHPILGYTRLHAGVDIGAPYGAPVVAARQGIVAIAGWQGGHGNYVRLDHGGGLATGYAHLSRIAVVPGERVMAGQRIGYVGSTGLSTGPHLHYEVFRNGRAVDPLREGVFAGSAGGSPSRAFVAAVASLRSLVKAP